MTPVSVLSAPGWSCCLMLCVTAWACHAFVKCNIDYGAQQETGSPITAVEMKVFSLHVMPDNLLHIILNCVLFLHVLSFPLSAYVNNFIVLCRYCILFTIFNNRSALIENLTWLFQYVMYINISAKNLYTYMVYTRLCYGQTKVICQSNNVYAA